MVRDAIARLSGRVATDSNSTRSGESRRPAEAFALQRVEGRAAAFTLLPLPRGGDFDGLCIIEPSVRCTHCGYCQSYGH